MATYIRKNGQLSKVSGYTASSGHTIENPSGTDMTQRANLQFADAHLTDDSVNDRTEVEITKEVTEADFDALNPQGTEHDGVYLMEAAGATPLTADMVGYDGGTVADALNTSDVSVTLNSSFILSNSAVSCRRLGKLVSLTGYMRIGSTPAIGDALITLSNISTTNKYQYAIATQTNGSKSFVLRINPNSNQFVIDNTPSSLPSSTEVYVLNATIFLE